MLGGTVGEAPVDYEFNVDVVAVIDQGKSPVEEGDVTHRIPHDRKFGRGNDSHVAAYQCEMTMSLSGSLLMSNGPTPGSMDKPS